MKKNVNIMKSNLRKYVESKNFIKKEFLKNRIEGTLINFLGNFNEKYGITLLMVEEDSFLRISINYKQPYGYKRGYNLLHAIVEDIKVYDIKENERDWINNAPFNDIHSFTNWIDMVKDEIKGKRLKEKFQNFQFDNFLKSLPSIPNEKTFLQLFLESKE